MRAAALSEGGRLGWRAREAAESEPPAGERAATRASIVIRDAIAQKNKRIIDASYFFASQDIHNYSSYSKVLYCTSSTVQYTLSDVRTARARRVDTRRGARVWERIVQDATRHGGVAGRRTHAAMAEAAPAATLLLPPGRRHLGSLANKRAKGGPTASKS